MKSINQKITDMKSLKSNISLKNNNATLINETSVYKEYAILKVGSLTLDGYFDLIRISGLRVYAGKLLRELRLKLSLSQKDFSKRFHISKKALAHWEYNRTAIPLVSIVKIAKELGITKKAIYALIRKKEVLIRNKINLSFRYEQFTKFLPYISIRNKDVLIIKQKGKKYVKQISELLHLKVNKSTNGQFVIGSKYLHDFLITFFEIKLIPKITPPLTSLLKNTINFDLRKAIICPLLQTDGSGFLDKRKGLYLISFKNISKELHNLLVDSIYLAYSKFLPSSYLLKDKLNEHRYTECYVTRYCGKVFQSVYTDLIKLCGNFKTSIYHSQDIDDYKKEPKPYLNYLLNANVIERILAIRIWASTEGAIIPMRRKKGGLIIPKLQISCANKELLFQLEKVTNSIGLHFTIRNEKGVGYKSLYNMAISCTLSFLKLGGFIDNVKISKSSRYYEGINKQDLIYATLEYMVRERENSSLRRLTMKWVHRRIRNIAKNKEYKNLNYYINFFSRNDKVQKCLNY